MFLSLAFNIHEKRPTISLPAKEITVSLSYRKPQKLKQKKIKKQEEKPREKLLAPSVKKVPAENKPAPKIKQVKKQVVPEKPKAPSQDESKVSKHEEQVDQAAKVEAVAKEIRKSELTEQAALSNHPNDRAALREARPLYRLNPPPKYPRIARKREYQGTVMLHVYVDSKGKVSDVELSESSGYKILDKAAIKAVKGWFFEPGQRGGKNVAMCMPYFAVSRYKGKPQKRRRRSDAAWRSTP